MDFDLGRAKGRIEIDSSGATRGINDANRAVSGFTNTASRSHGILRALGVGFAAVGVAAAAIIGTGIKLASDYQQAEIAFTNFLGSAEKGTAFLERLQEFAAKTPFEFPGIRDAAARLLGAGAAAREVIPLMTTVGDAVAGIGGGQEQIDRATLALTQMQLKGRVTGEELLQLTEAGIPAMQALAEGMGISVAEAQEKVAARQVDINTLFKILEEQAVPSLQRTAGMMDLQSQSLAGLFSTLKDTVGATLVAIAQPLVEGLTKALPGLTDTITNIMEELGPVFSDILGQVLKVVSKLLPAIVPLAKAFGHLFAGALASLIPVIKKLAPFLLEIGDFFGQIAEILGDAFAEALKIILPIMVELLQEVLVPMLPSLLELFRAIEPLIPLIVQLSLLAFKPLIAVLVALTPVLTKIISWVAKVITAFTKWVKESKLLEKITEVVAGIAEFVADSVMNLVDAIVLAWNTIKSVTLTVWHAIDAPVKAAFNIIKNVVRTGLHIIQAIWTQVWNFLKTFIIGPIGFIIDKVQGLIDKIKEAFEWLRNFLDLGIGDALNVGQFDFGDFGGGGPGSSPGRDTSGGGGSGGGSGTSDPERDHSGTTSVTLAIDGVAVTQSVNLHNRQMALTIGRRK